MNIKLLVIKPDGQITIHSLSDKTLALLAEPGVRYQLIDTETTEAPEKIYLKRRGEDLELRFDTDADSPELVIEGHFIYPESALVGMGADGHLHSYLPEWINLSEGSMLIGTGMPYGLSETELLVHSAFWMEHIDQLDTAADPSPAWGWLAALAAAGGSAAAVASGSGGVAAVKYVLSVVLGPQMDGGEGMVVTLYRADGSLLGTMDYDATANGYSYTDTTGYSGIVVAVVLDTDATPDFYDEATGNQFDMGQGKTLMAVLSVEGTAAVSLSLTELTTLAAKELGVSATVTPNGQSIKLVTIPTLDTVTVSNTNTVVASAFGLVDVDIVKDRVAPTVDPVDGTATTDANAYGVVLHMLSQYREVTRQTVKGMLNALSSALIVDAGTVIYKLNEEALAVGAAIQGAAVRVASSINMDGSGILLSGEVKATAESIAKAIIAVTARARNGDVAPVLAAPTDLMTDTGASNGIINDASITAPTNLSDGTKVQYLLKKGDETTASWKDISTAPAVDGSADDDYVLEVRYVSTSDATVVSPSLVFIFRLLTMPPTVMIESSDSSLKVGETATMTFTFSEIPTGFTSDAIDVEGGTLSAPVLGGDNGKVYTATFTPETGSTANGKVRIKAGSYTDPAGNAGTAGSLTSEITIDTVAPTVTVTIDGISPDTGSSTRDFITRDANGLMITATLSAALADGEELEYSNDDGQTWTEITSSMSGTAVSYVDTTLTSSTTIQFRVTDPAGNSGTVARKAITIDTIAPTVTVTIDGINPDTGSSTSDFITRDANGLTITAMLSAALADGEELEYSNDDGQTWTEITSSINGTAVSYADTSLISSATIQLRITDPAGNSGAVVSKAIVIDTTAPIPPTVTTLGTADMMPEISGTTGTGVALATGESLRVTVNGATYVVIPENDGTWSLDLGNLGTATLTGGSLGSFSVGNAYDVVATVADAAGNVASDLSNKELLIKARAAEAEGFRLTASNTLLIEIPELSGTATASEFSSTSRSTITSVTVDANTITLGFSSQIGRLGTDDEGNPYNDFILSYSGSALTSGDTALTSADFQGVAARIGNWDVSHVTDMSQMFRNAKAFNQDISDWDVGSVMTMRGMFHGADAFNQDISGWNIGRVMNMEYMFYSAKAFNQDISEWDVSSVTSISSIFSGATAFNQNIGGWDVDSVTKMISMFEGAFVFNQDISEWDVSSVTDMGYMFSGATAFNQDLSDWDVGSVVFKPNEGIYGMENMFGIYDGSGSNNAGMSQSNLDATLEGWADIETAVGENGLQEGMPLGVNTLGYADVTTAQYLINRYGWYTVKYLPELSDPQEVAMNFGLPFGSLVTIDGVEYMTTIVGSNREDEFVLIRESSGLYVHGLGGDDIIEGSNYADRLVGGTGNDRLKGGDGADIFVFQYQNSGTDRIIGFNINEDKLDISTLLDGYGVDGYGTTLSDFLNVYREGSDTRIDIDPNGKNTALATTVTIILDNMDTTLAALTTSVIVT